MTPRRVGADLEGRGKGGLFDRLSGFLVAGAERRPYREVAHELGMTEGAVKVMAHRLREKYRDLLREEIARTVDAPEQIDEEIRELFAALGAGRRRELS